MWKEIITRNKTIKMTMNHQVLDTLISPMTKMPKSLLPMKILKKDQVLKSIGILKLEEYILTIASNKKRIKMMPYMKESSFTNQESNFLISIILSIKPYIFFYTDQNHYCFWVHSKRKPINFKTQHFWYRPIHIK